MPERYSWAVALNATTGLISVEDGRVALGALLTPGSSFVNARSGFRPVAGEPGQVTPTPVTPDGNVRVAPFQFVMQSGRASVAGAYLTTLDAQKIINILSTPANATNNRNDLVVAQQSDTFYGDANSGMVVKQVVGTPSGTPVDPPVPGSPDYITLARVVVRANTLSILGSDITDLRPAQKYTTALGGLIPVASQAVRDGIAAPYNGLPVWRQDRAWVEVYDGTAFRVQGVAICTSVADRNAAITNPYSGQSAVTTDTMTRWIYRGGAWVVAAAVGIGGAGLAVKTTDLTVNNSTVLVSDAQLVVAVDANATYAFESCLIYSATTVAKAAMAVTGPAGASGLISPRSIDVTVTAYYGPIEVSMAGLGGTFSSGAIGVGQKVTALATGTITTAGTAGNIAVQFAQSTAEVSNAALHALSWIKLTRIA